MRDFPVGWINRGAADESQLLGAKGKDDEKREREGNAEPGDRQEIHVRDFRRTRPGCARGVRQ